MTSMLQGIARVASAALGRESLLIRKLRPAYESALNRLSGGRGIEWEINGALYRIDPHFRHQMGHNYEPAVASFLQTGVRPGHLCFDVGANVGVYALQLARWSTPSGRVVAFEPNPAAAAVLRRHLTMNGLLARVTVAPLAVGDRDGEATLYAVGADGMSRLGEPNEQLAGRTTPATVRTIRLDEFCRQSGLIPNWLLIDIEGFEFAALRGASDLIKGRRGKLGIVVEMHPSVWRTPGTSRAEAEALLRELGLQAMPLTGQADALGEHGVVHLAFK